jgi:hypothetical protein
MLNQLYQLEKELPKLLQDENSWNSLYVDYHKPYVKRLWKPVGDYRIFLHQIFPCEKSESLLHPHPWPSAMKVVGGIYEMGVGYSQTNDEPVIASTLVLPVNSYYEMADINSWHYVRPLDKPSFSLMVTGKPWKRESPKSDHKMRELNAEEKRAIFDQFRNLYLPK